VLNYFTFIWGSLRWRVPLHYEVWVFIVKQLFLEVQLKKVTVYMLNFKRIFKLFN